MLFRYKYDDNEAGDENPPSDCDNAQPVTSLISVPTRKPPTDCTPLYYPTLTYADTGLDETVPVLIPFVPIAGATLSFWARSTQANLILEILDSDGNVLDFDDNPDGFSTSTDWGGNAIVSYTFPNNDLYYARITGDNTPWDYTLIITSGVNPAVTLTATQWRCIAVPSTSRIFCQSAYEVADDSNATTVNMTNNTVINTVLLNASDPGQPFTAVSPIIFYNPHDNSVWMVQRNPATNAGFFQRFNPTTGAHLETFAVSAPAIEQGEYSPATNHLYAFVSTDLTGIQVYDCTTRAFLPTIILPDGGQGIISPPAFAYDPDTERIFVTTENGTGTARLLRIDNTDTATSIVLAKRAVMNSNHMLVHDGFIYSGTFLSGPDWLSKIDPNTGTITDLFRAKFSSYRPDCIGFDEFLNEIVIVWRNNNGGHYTNQALRVDPDTGNILSNVLVVKYTDGQQTFHPDICYNSFLCRLAVLTSTDETIPGILSIL